MYAVNRILLAGLVALLTSCSTLSYYHQSVDGHLNIMSRRTSIEGLLKRKDLDPLLRQRLQQALAIRRFASTNMRLPDNGSYRSYVDTGKRYVVWNVIATPALSLRPVVSCFPFVGCLAYRGYYSKARADAAGQALRSKGLDVFVAGVPAYSTLGWFDDPLLNTMLRWGEAQLAGYIFHELAHQLVYVKDDTMFNESFATVVEQVGVERWLKQGADSSALQRWRIGKQRDEQLVELLLQTRKRLQELYALKMKDADKLAEKKRIFRAMRQSYRKLRSGWGGYRGFDDFMGRVNGNAHLTLVATYHQWVPAFRRMYAGSGEDIGKFYNEVRRLAELPKQQRTGELQKLLK